MNANENHPGDAEAAAAAAGMRDVYGHGIKVGDERWFQPAVGRMPIPGRVLDVTPGLVQLQTRDGEEHIVPISLIAEF
jgi:hypothetical protein